MEKSEFIKVRGRNFICQLCDIKITSEGAIEDHLAGRKHLRLLSRRESRQQQTQKSIFVGGLCRSVGESDLSHHFSKFGDVAQIFIDKEKAHYAIVEFHEAESARSAAHLEKQELNGRKIVVRPRQPKPTSSAAHGREAAAQGGRKTKTDGQGKQETQPQLHLDADVQQQLQREESVSGQMATLVGMTQLTPDDQNLRRLVCDLLQTSLEEFLPGCCVVPFGSSVSGFGVRGCDLDIHLELGDPSQAVRSAPEKPRATTEDGELVPPGPLEERSLPDMALPSPLDVLSLVSDVVRRCVPSCHDVRLIPSARLPVLTFTHRESRLHCDVSTNNRLALKNTRLLQFYGELAREVRPLVFAVRHWAKRHQLAGNVGAGPRLTNYALTLMALFYLQARAPCILPGVAQLMHSGEGSESTFSIDNWPSNADSAEPLDALLVGFFGFYETFDFATTVICPLLGRKAPLSSMPLAGPGMETPGQRSFKVGAVNIQDPFELWHNVALNVNERTAQRLVQELRVAAQVCRSNWMANSDASWGLVALMDPAAPSSAKTLPSPSGSSSVEALSLEITLRSSHLSEGFVLEHPDPEDLKAAWCDAVKRLVYRLLSEALRFECLWSSRADQTASPGTKTLINPTSVEGCKVEQERCERSPSSVRTDASPESTTQLTDSTQLPPSKRCKIDPSCASSQPSSSPRERGGSQEAQASMVDPWHTETDSLECSTQHPVWLGRRKARRQLQQSKQKQQGHINPAVKQEGSSRPGSTPDEKKPATADKGVSPNTASASSVGDPCPSGCHKEMVKLGCPSDTDQGVSQQKLASSPPNPSTTSGRPSPRDNIPLESQVTDLIISEQLIKEGHSPGAPIVKFSLHLSDKLTPGQTGMTLHFVPIVGEADFKIFLHFFDIFLKKMLDQSQM